MNNDKTEFSEYKIEIGTAIHQETFDKNGRVAETYVEIWRAV
ncbi:MAG: hypothetical protein AB7V07_10565 [Candidatus Delongbacteria bacterium]